MISNIVTFTSDFGLQDEWVAAVKGVILSINSHAEIFDISHQLPSFNLRKGSLVLQSALPYFPMGTHLAVIDPGVGSDRRAIAIKANRGDILVGPDNGLLIDAANRLGGIEMAVNITNSKYFLEPVCPTFQARDIFAPVTAHLSRGEGMVVFGNEIDPGTLIKLDLPIKEITKDEIKAEVVDIDNYGTVRINADLTDLKSIGLDKEKDMAILINKHKSILPLVKTFNEVKLGKPMLIIDSSGFLSLSVNRGNAAISFKMKIGDLVFLRRSQAD